MQQAGHVPEERHQHTHYQGIEQPGEEIAGGRAVHFTELARQDLIEAKAQR
ncbi:hypothetical protein D3C75_1287690 [compost metagenome]